MPPSLSRCWSNDDVHLRSILQRAQRGDREALDELVLRSRPPLLRFVRLNMGSALLLRVEPDDVVQDVFVQALRSVARVTDPRHWMRLLLVQARRRIADAARFHGRACRTAERCVSFDCCEGQGGRSYDPEAGTSTPSVHLSLREQRCAVVAAIDRLGPDQRRVILLRDYERLEWEEIRVEMGRPTVKAVQQLYRRAQIALRMLLVRLGE